MLYRHFLLAGPVLPFMLAPFASARAQQREAQLLVSGGIATDQRGARSSAFSIAPSLTFTPSSGAILQLSGNATRFGTQSWSLGGGASFDGRDAIGQFLALTLSASAGGNRLLGSSPASFAEAHVLPAVELKLEPLTAFGGVRAAAGLVSEQEDIPGFPVGSPDRTTQVSRAGAGPLFGVVFDMAPRSGGSVRLGARDERLRVENVTVVDRSIGVSVMRGAITLGGTLGIRSASDERTTFSTLAASFGLGHSMILDFGAGRYPRNRMLGTPGGSYVTGGLRLRAGSAPGVTPAIRVAGAPPVPRGATRLALRASDARRVEVGGDFNDWKLVPARRARDGIWYADLVIPPGQYRYAFRVDGTEWRVPHGATAVNDEFGGKSAWLTVSDARPRSATSRR